MDRFDADVVLRALWFAGGQHTYTHVYSKLTGE